jgi:hypothetical protein
MPLRIIEKDPEIQDEKKCPDPGSGINIPDQQHCPKLNCVLLFRITSVV